MGRLLVASGEKQAALDVLQKAREVAPGTMSRIRELSSLAVSAGKPEVAEAVMRQALQKHKFSPVRQANDYATLSKALVNQGKAGEALTVVAEAQKSFNDKYSGVLLAATESVAHRAAGNHAQAEAAIAKAMEHGDLSGLPTHTVIALADACFVMGKEDDATRLLNHAIQNNHEDDTIKGRVHDVLTSAGKDPLQATAMIEASTQEVILLNNDGVRKAQAGQLLEAIELLCQAANRLPNNLQILSNAALVIALDLVRNGNTPDKMGKCINYRNLLIKKSPSHPKLAQIDDLLKQLTP
jgi:tetratricopeptide (TPR) repeat protein